MEAVEWNIWMCVKVFVQTKTGFGGHDTLAAEPILFSVPLWLIFSKFHNFNYEKVTM
jgi:hypothetical protein